MTADAMRRSPVTLGSPRFRTISTAEFRVTEAEFPAYAVLPIHAHEHTVLSVILRGGFALQLDRATHDCSAGTVFVEPSGVPHGDRLGASGARVLIIELGTPIPDDLRASCAVLLREPRAFQDSAVAMLGLQVGRHLNASCPAPLGVQSDVLDLLGTAAQRVGCAKSARPDRWLDRVRDMLHDTIGSSVRVGDLAREAGVHRVHLGRAFRARYGVSVGAYHRRLRVQWAAAQLRICQDPIGHIAMRAGFSDHAHFTRVFKREMGVTPQDYRQGRPATTV